MKEKDKFANFARLVPRERNDPDDEEIQTKRETFFSKSLGRDPDNRAASRAPMINEILDLLGPSQWIYL